MCGSTMRILFIRHGESEANVEQIISNRDLPHKLTQTGVMQATILAETLAHTLTVEVIETSPILRARETAVILQARLDVIPTVQPVLREFDCGAMEGRGDAEAWAAHQAIVQAWDTDHDYDKSIPPDGESFNDMQARFVPYIKNLIQQHKDHSADILLVSHGGLLLQMLPLVLTNVDRPFTQQNHINNCQLIITQLQDEQLICTNWGDIQFT